LGAVTTHDLPTVAGVWTGADAEAQRRAGIPLNEEGAAYLRRRLAEWTGSGDGRPVPEVIEATYAVLGEAPSTLLVASLDDAQAVEERPNMPGTIDQWPNWCLALPASLEEMEQLPLPAAIAMRLGGH
jgi:4-alpha-glucanotransferase